jgi:hypothetical protein
LIKMSITSEMELTAWSKIDFGLSVFFFDPELSRAKNFGLRHHGHDNRWD